jgi:hypothetical protein
VSVIITVRSKVPNLRMFSTLHVHSRLHKVINDHPTRLTSASTSSFTMDSFGSLVLNRVASSQSANSITINLLISQSSV